MKSGSINQRRSCESRRKVALFTLGCKINQYDTNSVIAGLKNEGHEQVAAFEDADVIVINTCTVTGRTDYKGRQQIRRAIEQNPQAVVIVTGCYAQVQADAIAGIHGVDYILGNAEKSEMPLLISRCSKQSTPVIRVDGLQQKRALDPGPLHAHSGNTRAFLKIQDGCDHACSYCIIPRARGKSRSLSMDKTMEKVRNLAHRGFKEMVLCGIHLGVYGLDLDPLTTLHDLLLSLEQDAPVPRIRMSSIEPNELMEKTVDLFAHARHLCPHFHLSMQSGDAGILRAMNRRYDPLEFHTLVTRIKQKIPDAAIGVDVIAGFPGETDDAFRSTLDLLRSLPISYLHVFPYSARPGTPSASFPNPVPSEQIRERAHRLRSLGKEKKASFYRRVLNRKIEVLVESSRDPETGLLKGFSRNYIPVLLEGPDTLQNRCVTVLIEAVEGARVEGCVEGASSHSNP